MLIVNPVHFGVSSFSLHVHTRIHKQVCQCIATSFSIFICIVLFEACAFLLSSCFRERSSVSLSLSFPLFRFPSRFSNGNILVLRISRKYHTFSCSNAFYKRTFLSGYRIVSISLDIECGSYENSSHVSILSELVLQFLCAAWNSHTNEN